MLHPITQDTLRLAPVLLALFFAGTYVPKKKNNTQNLGLIMGSYCQSGVLEPGIHPGGEGEIDRLLLWYPITGTSGNTTKKIIMITQ